MQRIRTYTLVLLVFVLSIPSILPVSANSAIGVKTGDWAIYDIRAWKANKTQTEDWMDSLINETNKTSWINVTVEGIVDNELVKILQTDQKNGSADSIRYSGSPERTPSYLKYWVISSGLEKGDYISLEAENFTVLDTRLTKYANATRLIVHGFLTSSELPQMVEYYWDQKTGILCSCLFTYQGSETLHVVFREIIMTETNIWEPDPNITSSWWPAIVVAAVVAAIFITAFLSLTKIKQRKSKKKLRR